MIECVRDVIKAVAGQNIGLSAQIIDENTGESVDKHVCMLLHNDNEVIYRAEGLYMAEFELWQFEIPAEITKGLEGKYWYCFQYDGNNLCFKQPIYLI